MGASLIQQCRVGEDGLRVVKPFKRGGTPEREYRFGLTLPAE